mmetsp:Transcript_10213/g.30317  ORF Transcript_10213/g.30317 Transcript_10213/m.30317 type:complete len:471 (-) Transcript_10213:654-2066(-)
MSPSSKDGDATACAQLRGAALCTGRGADAQLALDAEGTAEGSTREVADHAGGDEGAAGAVGACSHLCASAAGNGDTSAASLAFLRPLRRRPPRARRCLVRAPVCRSSPCGWANPGSSMAQPSSDSSSRMSAHAARACCLGPSSSLRLPASRTCSRPTSAMASPWPLREPSSSLFDAGILCTLAGLARDDSCSSPLLSFGAVVVVALSSQLSSRAPGRSSSAAPACASCRSPRSASESSASICCSSSGSGLSFSRNLLSSSSSLPPGTSAEGLQGSCGSDLSPLAPSTRGLLSASGLLLAARSAALRWAFFFAASCLRSPSASTWRSSSAASSSERSAASSSQSSASASWRRAQPLGSEEASAEEPGFAAALGPATAAALSICLRFSSIFRRSLSRALEAEPSGMRGAGAARTCGVILTPSNASDASSALGGGARSARGGSVAEDSELTAFATSLRCRTELEELGICTVSV